MWLLLATTVLASAEHNMPLVAPSLTASRRLQTPRRYALQRETSATQALTGLNAIAFLTLARRPQLFALLAKNDAMILGRGLLSTF